jgi:hypothetical protein
VISIVSIAATVTEKMVVEISFRKEKKKLHSVPSFVYE